MKPKLAIFVSGKGTNLQSIIDAIDSNILYAEICVVLSNHANSKALDKAKNANIETIYEPYFQEDQTREEYDYILTNKIKSYQPDIIVLAGWMHIFTKFFLDYFPRVINLHPALPNTFIGKDCITKAFKSYKRGEIKHTGVMVHHTTTDLDAGKVISQIKVPIKDNDSLENLEERISKMEKGVLISAIQKQIQEIMETNINQTISSLKLLKKGKVKDVYDLGYNLLCIDHTDRISAFDRYICDVPGKGLFLNQLNIFWMNLTHNIISNHYIYARDNLLIVKKCQVIPIEFIVRGYITGNTNTSLWTHYNNGSRNYCGNKLPEGLSKHQKLETALLTPTTKEEHDRPISTDEIIKENIMYSRDLKYLKEIAFQLYEYGSSLAKKQDLILVDTKYEFGYDAYGNIILIDEMHTGDSSRYWKLDSYNDRFKQQLEPEKFDKDAIRDYIKSQNNSNCEIPFEVKQRVINSYSQLYTKLTTKNIKITENPSIEKITSNYLNNYHNPKVIILSGSEKDSKFVNKIQTELNKSNIFSQSIVASAHKQTKKVLDIIEKNTFQKVVWVTVAGRSNALSGVVAANCKQPVIACPPFGDKTDMLVNINSSLQCPSNVPVMTILEPSNVALAIERIFSL